MRIVCWVKKSLLIGGLSFSFWSSPTTQADEIFKLSGKSATGLIGGVGAATRQLFLTDADKGNDTEEVCRRRFRFRATFILTPGSVLAYPQSGPIVSYFTPPATIAPAPVFSPSLSYQPIGADLGNPTVPAPLNLKNTPPTQSVPEPSIAPNPSAAPNKPEGTFRYDGGPSRPVPQPTERVMPPSNSGPKLGPAPNDMLPQPAPIERMISQPLGGKFRFRAYGETDTKPTAPSSDRDKGTLLIKGEQKGDQRR